MAFDLIGINPKQPIGYCYRLNVWKWHELWNFLQFYCNSLISDVEYWYTNDGELVSEEICKNLLDKLKQPDMIIHFNEYLNKRKKLDYMSFDTYRPICSQDVEAFCIFLSECNGFAIT
jgi:hypothetical protein